MKRSATIDMTHGPLLGKILRFSLPLMASNILQMLFSAADSVVVGRFAGHASLAAVGSTVSIIALFVNLLIGASVGVNVVIAHYRGTDGARPRDLPDAAHRRDPGVGRRAFSGGPWGSLPPTRRCG